MGKLIPVTSNRKCQYYILCAVDFYTTRKGKNVVTIQDVQNFIQGYTIKELRENACILINRNYIKGEFTNEFNNIKMFGITEKGQEYFDEL